eukprot:9371557-Pyramimonas_sp.AAC.1
MQARPLEPSVELHVGPRNVWGVSNWVALTHASAATGAFGGAPFGATDRVRGVPKWVALTHANAATWAFGGAPYLATGGPRAV